MASSSAQTYFNSFSPEDQQKIRDSWGGADLMDEWFKNAKDAGAVTASGQSGNMEQRVSQANEAYARGERGSAATTPGLPTPSELRAKAKREGWSEDFDRFSDDTLRGWINGYYDPATGKFRSMRGASGSFEKPTECPDGMVPGGPDETNGCINPNTGETTPGGGASPGAGGGAPAAPPKPTTFGSQLSYTGNPLTDMLLYQFNTGTQLSDPSKMNMFAMGEDKQEGGTGANADQGARTGQLLQGGGLWWQGPQEAGQDAFGGFRADTQNASPTAAPAAPAVPPAPSTTQAPTPQAIAQPAQAEKMQAGFGPSQATNMSGMLETSFKPRETWRNKANREAGGMGGVDNPMAF